MAKAKKSKGFLAAAGSLLGSIPAVGSVKNAAKKVKQATKKTVQKVKKVVKVAKKAVKKTVKKKKKQLAASLKKAAKKAKKKAKKKIGKVFTKARKLKNNLSPKQQIKKLKKNMKKAVLAKKPKKKKKKDGFFKQAGKVLKKAAKKTTLAAKALTKVNLKETLSLVVDFIPVVGNVKAAVEVLTGRDPITGRKLEDWERVAAVAAIVGGAVVKGAVRGTKATLGIVSNVAGAGKKVTKPIDKLPTSKKPEPKTKVPEKVKVTTEVVSGAERAAGKAQVPKGAGKGKVNDVNIDNFDFGKYLKKNIGDPPEGMKDPHAHHILFKKGNGKAQQKLVKEGQEILREYDIDPIFGVENLTWAPNRVKDQHGIEALQNVVDNIKEVKFSGGDRDDMVERLKELGKVAARRGE